MAYNLLALALLSTASGAIIGIDMGHDYTKGAKSDFSS